MIELKKELAKRYDGYWELLATAVGMPESVEKTMKALSVEELSKEAGHPDWIVGERVEALAAWNPCLLADLAKSWRPPREKRFLLWLDAWRSSLRHLKALGAVQPDEVDVPELADEIDALWGKVPDKSVSWLSALRMVKQQPIFNYNLVRKLWRVPLVDPYPSLSDLLEAPPWMLPLLRGNVSKLFPDVQDFLVSAGQSCLEGELISMPYVARKWVVGPDRETALVTEPLAPAYRPLGQTPLKGNLSDGPPILELCKEISPGITDALAERLAEKIPRIADPKSIAKIVYILVTDWHLA